jgi:2-dehydro-3-deoxyphosphogluconate aldolase/(4S)-4-hydroxy-2-oxoglutarate aldolase
MAPGIATPSELEAAMEKGLKTVKFFPAEAIGGLEYLKSMSAPYSGVKFIPTGGINADNILTYLRFNKVLACGGSWMVKDELIAAQKFDKIAELVVEAVKMVSER